MQACIFQYLNDFIVHILVPVFVFFPQSFARRGLSKINELSQLETMSSSKNTPEREAAFRQATIKVKG